MREGTRWNRIGKVPIVRGGRKWEGMEGESSANGTFYTEPTRKVYQVIYSNVGWDQLTRG